MKKILLLLFLALRLICASPSEAASPDPKNILILLSYEITDTWSDSILKGVREVLTGNHLQLYVESLDARRRGDRHKEDFKRFLAAKYADIHLDIAIAADNAAFDLFLNFRPEFRPRLPVVFCGVNNFTPDMIAGQSEITGVNEAVDIIGTVSLALRLFPKTGHITVIANSQGAGAINLSRFREAMQRIPRRVSVTELVDVAYHGAEAALSALPAGSPVFRMGDLLQPDGTNIERRQSVKTVASLAPGPVFTFWEPEMGLGELGGVLVSALSQGRKAGELALQALNGKPVSEIPVVMNSPNVPIFDYRQMQRFGADAADLPPGAVVLRMPESFYARYKVLIWSISGLLIFMMVCIAASVMIIFERRRSEADLRQKSNELATVIEAIPAMVWTAHDPDCRYITGNRYVYDLIGASPGENLSQTAADKGEAIRIRHLKHDGTELRSDELPIQKVIASGEKILNYEFEYVFDDGRRMFTVGNAVPLFDKAGKVSGAVAAFVDITERKRAEEALRESVETHRAMIKGLPDVVMRFDRRGCHLFVSENVRNAVDIDPAQFIGKTHADLGFPEPLCRFWEESVRSVFSSGEAFETEYSFESRQGPAIHNWRLIPERDAQGAVCSVLSISRDITEHRRTEQNYRTLFREMLDGFALHEIICDKAGAPADYRFLAVNPAFERMTGLKAEDAVNRTVLEVMPGTERYWIDTYGRVALTGEPAFFENYSAGLGKHFEVSAFRPAPGQFVCIFQDVTERKRAEADLRKNQKFLADLIENSGALIVIKDRDGRNLMVNRKWEEITGLTRNAVLGKTDDMIFPEKTARQFRENDLCVIESGSAVETEELLETPSGTRWFISVKFPLIADDGTISGLCGIITEITDRKNSEKALQESEARFKALHNASFGGIAIHDKGIILECNRGLSEMSGFSSEELIGMDGLLLIAEQSRRTVMNNIVSGYEKPYEAAGLRKNGEEYPLRLEARNIPYKGKNVRTVEFRDITEIRRAEAEREKLQAQLSQAQKMESVGRLAGGVAHDFNNMLSIITGYAEMAMDAVDPAEPLHAYLKEILTAAGRSAEITRQLLAFARKQTVSPKVIDLNDTVEGMLRMLRRLIGEDIDLRWLPGSGLRHVRIDPVQTDQILANLSVNARDAIAGVGKITIETHSAIFDAAYCADHTGFVPGDFVLLAFSDDGCGIDKDTLAHIFEPFFTTKDVNRGTGLGLATVFGIVKQNNGFINVYSEPGKGTTFKIYLPCYAGETEKVSVGTSAEIKSVRSETVLLVEDDPVIIEMVKIMLETLGYRVLSATLPDDAVRLAEKHKGKIDLLVTDVIMPGMNGRDLENRLRSIFPDIRTLFMSGYTADVIAHRGLLEKGMNFIQKPFSRKDLGAKVREVMGTAAQV